MTNLHWDQLLWIANKKQNDKVRSSYRGVNVGGVRCGERRLNRICEGTFRKQEECNDYIGCNYQRFKCSSSCYHNIVLRLIPAMSRDLQKTCSLKQKRLLQAGASLWFTYRFLRKVGLLQHHWLGLTQTVSGARRVFNAHLHGSLCRCAALWSLNPWFHGTLQVRDSAHEKQNNHFYHFIALQLVMMSVNLYFYAFKQSTLEKMYYDITFYFPLK